MIRNLCLFLLLLAVPLSSQAQDTQISKILNWKKISIPAAADGQGAMETESFDGADFSARNKGLPWFGMTIPLSGYGRLLVKIKNMRLEPVQLDAGINTSILTEEVNIEHSVNMERKNFIGVLRFIPMIKTGAGIMKITAFELDIRRIPELLPLTYRGGPTLTSVLSEGSIYKISVENTGIHKIDAKLLRELGIDIAKLDPRKLKIYGNASGMLPELIASPRIDDLAENPIFVSGEDDGNFGENDYILFFAQGADRWDYNPTKKQFQLEKNVYSFTANYFIKIDGENGKRITERPSIGSTAHTSTSLDDFLRYEKESVNLLAAFNYTTGSGRKWYGDKLTPNKSSIGFSDFILPNVDKNELAKVRSVMAIRSGRSSVVTMNIQGKTFSTNSFGVSLSSPEDTYANDAAIEAQFLPNSDNFNTSLSVVASSGDFEAWLDYIEINARRSLKMTGSQMLFQDQKTLAYPSATFELANGSGMEIWNISNPVFPQRQKAELSNETLRFGVETSNLQRFIAFNPNAADLFKPKAVGKVENQNLHGIQKADMVIVYPEAFESEANRLAAHRRNFNKLNVVTVEIGQIFNEFSSGAMDVTAIRDFAKMLYDRDENFRYLLLAGDGSFNHRNIGVDASKNTNWIPVYETEESLNPIFAFPSDDYFGLLSPNEGNRLQGSLDIDIGRLTAQDADQLKAIIDKIIHYDSNPEAMRDYRNRVVFVTDDVDETWEYIFLQHSEETLWKEATTKYPNFNTEKIYLDAYTQVTTPGGQRSPDCQEAINNNMFKGSLVVNYVGHGGPRGWAQERILNANEDVPTWSNFERLPLMITATCSFAGYDNPNNFTAGEQVLALDKGGAVGLFATVRSVYASANDVLTKSVFSEIYKKTGINGRAMGEILRSAKNNSGTDTENNRKFAMLGDPSQRLMIPQYNISTTAINGKPVLGTAPVDTVGAMSKLVVEGQVTDSTGKILDWFEGKIYPTIFDKEITMKTIPNLQIQQSFKAQNRILFKGVATVKKGKFRFECIIPKDIDYNFGLAKISYYASNNSSDATGFDNAHLVVGGAARNPVKDDKAPIVEVFMDNENFVNGGKTSSNPTLLVRLTDDVGFNVSGSSVGHDMKAVLNDNTQNTFRLNEFYEAVSDDFTKGFVRYPLAKLKEGPYKISVKAWDTANNPGEGVAEFIVAGNGKTALEHVLNYPNPFTTHTGFQFRHHLSEVNLKVQIRIFSVSGRLVKTIFADAFSENGSVTDIGWDGKDDFGDDLARGVYLYKIHIESARNSNLAQESDFEKLVILK